MQGLLPPLLPQATKRADAMALAKVAVTKKVATAIKGGNGLYARIATMNAVITAQLGHYADKYRLLRTDDEVFTYFEHIKRAGEASIDTETDSLDPLSCALAGVGVYVPGQQAAYMPMHHISHVTGEEYVNQVKNETLRKCLEECNVAGTGWVMHNAKFDTRVLTNSLGVTIPCSWDTQLAARCLNENERAKLKILYPKYCAQGDTTSFEFSELFQGVPFTYVPITTAYLYAAGDPIKTWELKEFQQKYLTEDRLKGVYYVFQNIEMPLVPVVAAMEDRGITLDVAFAKELSEKYTKQLREREGAFYSILNQYAKQITAYKRANPEHGLSDPVKVSSVSQIATIFYDVLGLKSTDPEKPRGTGEDILSELDHPLAKALFAYRETSKLLSTYVDKLPKVLHPKTQRVHADFNQYGADTGRFTSSDPNMQNIPSHNGEIRKMFTASPGFVLVSCDFSQQEPRILAHMSQDATLLQAYRDHKDIYAWIAEHIYKVPYAECLEFYPDGTKNPEGKKRRASVKSIILGIMYGMGAGGIAEQLGISVKAAREIVDRFNTTFPKVIEWIDMSLANAKQQGFVETAWGRKRRLPNIQLPPYEFALRDKIRPSFDPLRFEVSPETSLQVNPAICQQYVLRLNKLWKRQDKQAVIRKASAEGILIKDNGGWIAEARRQCVNSIIQGSAADMTKLAMIAIGNNERLRKLDCHMLLQVHDELIAECPERYARECAEILSRLMVEVAAEKIAVPMKCDAEVTRVWYGDSIKF